MVAEFTHHIKAGLAKKSFVNRNRAKSLIKIALGKYEIIMKYKKQKLL